MILAYLVVSCFLSFIGALFFKYIARDRLTILQERWLIYGTLAFCLLGPIIAFHIFEKTNLNNSSYLLSSLANNQDCGQEEINEECLRIEADGGFCDCELIREQNIIAYRANEFYDFADYYRFHILSLLKVIGVLILLILLVRIGYLLWLIHRSGKQRLELEGVKFIKLVNEQIRSVGSFKLLRNYVIWDNRLNSFPKDEKQAVMLHEVSHLQQKNTWELLIMGLIQCFWFLNPVFYFFKNELIRISELIADEFAVDRLKTHGKKWYAGLILKIYESDGKAIVSGFAKSHAKERIHHLVGNRPRRKRSFVLVFSAMLLIMSVSTAVSMSYVGSEKHMLDAYHFLKEKNQITGRTIFCKDCIEYPSTY